MALKCVGSVVCSRALRFTLLVLLAALAGPVAACGGSGSKNGSAAAPTAKATSEPTNATANASAEPGLIVFRRWSDTSHTHGAILTMASNGSGERPLDDPTGSLSDDYPDITPDGSAVAFQRCGDSESSCSIFTMPADGTQPRRVGGCRPGERPPRCADSSYPAIAPNGGCIAFVRKSGPLRADGDTYEFQGIFTMRMDGSRPRRVTLERTRDVRDGEPQWSPDARRLVFVRENDAAQPAGGQAIFIVNANGRGLHRITPWQLHAGDGPNWSPDGRRILFRSNESDTFMNSNLFTVGSDGTGLKQITHLPPTKRLYSSGFSPDGTSITFGMQGTNGEPDVYTMRLDGSRLAQVTHTPLGDSAPDWGATSG
jgi:TolB protein